MNNEKDMLMNWDDAIETDGQEYILLPEGEYNFKVINFERGRFVGSARIPQCNKASITIQIEAKEGTTSVKFDLILYRTLEWRISAFFRCIGQKKHGEKLTMDWGKVVGSKGRAYIKQRSYTNQNGEEKFINDVDRFIDYNEDFFDDLPF
jgi:hypothetical protein